jgi:hypothetical protein
MQVASFPSQSSPCGTNPDNGMVCRAHYPALQQVTRLLAATWHAAPEGGFQKMMRTTSSIAQKIVCLSRMPRLCAYLVVSIWAVSNPMCIIPGNA